MENKIILDQRELQAIKKMIFFIKFECNDSESEIFAGSDQINSILEKVMKADIFSNHQINRLEKIDTEIKDKVFSRLKTDSQYNSMNSDQKLRYVRSLIYPYTIDEIQ